MLDNQIFPHLHLLVSGGNTQLLFCKSISDWKIIGATLDDAAGECFDKISRMVGLPYPSGLYLAKIAKVCDYNYLNLPISMQNDSLNFSFSGLKTSARTLIQNHAPQGLEFMQSLKEEEIASLIQATSLINLQSTKLAFTYCLTISVQSVIVSQLTSKLKLAISKFQPKSVGISGGVSANLLLRQQIQEIATAKNIPLFLPNLKLTGDNAIMINLSGLSLNLQF